MANVAAGLEPGQPLPIADTAFRPVVVPGTSAEPDALLAVAAALPVPTVRTDLPALAEPFPATTPPPQRAQPSLAAPKPIVVTPKPKFTHALTGPASYYCWAGSSPCTNDYPDVGGVQAYAAAGPKLRAALGSDWRGSIVYVDGIRVKIIDWCQCYQGESNEKLLDLYHDVFARTGSRVTIRW